MNANPNKRQRQPALLGDHPPEYGKALGGPVLHAETLRSYTFLNSTIHSLGDGVTRVQWQQGGAVYLSLQLLIISLMLII